MQTDVIVVGAGLAGLCCALELQKRSVDSLLLEAGDRPGGRVVTDMVDGFRLDRGFQILLKAYPEARAVLDYDALNLKPFYTGCFIWRRGKMVRFGDPFRDPRAWWSALTAPIGTLVDRWRLFRLRAGLKNMDLDEVTHKPQKGSTAEFLREKGFSQDLIEGFFQPFIGGVFLENDLATSKDFFRFTMRMFSEDDVAVPAEGMGAIPRQLLNRLPEEAIQFNRRVVGCRADGVTLEGGESLAARKVIVATDGDAASRLLDVGPVPHRSVTNLYFAGETAPINEPALVLFPEAKWVNNLHVVSRVAPNCAPAGKELISVTVVRHFSGSPEALEQEVRGELKACFGNPVENWKLLRIYRLGNALPFTSQTEIERVKRAARDRGVILCGDYLGVPSIQHAMVSGRRAGEQVASQFD